MSRPEPKVIHIGVNAQLKYESTRTVARSFRKSSLDFRYVRALDSPFFISTNVGSFSSQDKYCEENNGRLVTIGTQGKYDRIMELDGQNHDNAISSDKLFIGLISTSTDCSYYQWSSGQTMAWSKWDLEEREPNNCMTERCVALIFGFFRTITCHVELKVLCELGYYSPSSNLFFNPSSTNWMNSVMYCSMIGGRLIVLEDEQKMQQTMRELQNIQKWYTQLIYSIVMENRFIMLCSIL
ncbi:uncharacterized protein LOC117333944 [Pecten maximus]|uniref:uncharacterized protein LOC117333944 n=1 Tax=Pecten maximus TaxID=6579 RepID=UPI001459008E|nr:uncharacterized protein LOC117333944 [Pecten maximus]